MASLEAYIFQQDLISKEVGGRYPIFFQKTFKYTPFNIRYFIVLGAGPSFQRERTSTDIRVRCGHRPPSHARRAHMSPCQRWDKRSLRGTERRRALSVEKNVLLRCEFDFRMRLAGWFGGKRWFLFLNWIFLILAFDFHLFLSSVIYFIILMKI